MLTQCLTSAVNQLFLISRTGFCEHTVRPMPAWVWRDVRSVFVFVSILMLNGSMWTPDHGFEWVF